MLVVHAWYPRYLDKMLSTTLWRSRCLITLRLPPSLRGLLFELLNCRMVNLCIVFVSFLSRTQRLCIIIIIIVLFMFFGDLRKVRGILSPLHASARLSSARQRAARARSLIPLRSTKVFARFFFSWLGSVKFLCSPYPACTFCYRAAFARL